MRDRLPSAIQNNESIAKLVLAHEPTMGKIAISQIHEPGSDRKRTK